MGTEYETLQVEQCDSHVLIVKMNRPNVRNAFNTQMATDLRDQFLSLHVSQEDLRCVILTGAGDKAFCAGGDLKERNDMTTEQWQQQHVVFEQMAMAIMECPLPIIAAVNGAAFGGGCELALAVDFIYAAQSARFALPETKLGIMPGTGGTQNLPRACGFGRAKEIIFTGRPFTSEQALEWGIVNKVCADETLLEDAKQTASEIAANGPIAVQQAKKAIKSAIGNDLRASYALEIEAYQKVVPTEDRFEGVRAFNEKRPPKFRGK